MTGPRIGELCTGYGGLGMGVQEVYGGEVVWVSDIDPGANKILAHRFPDAPNLGDFTKTDWSTVSAVDILCAGFPCQPVSGAGKGLGDKDERWLWDEVHRAVREVRPGLVVLENVRGLVSRERGRLFARVLGTLADIGYDTCWHGLKASDVGAPHGRFRYFITATDAERGGRDGWSRAPRRGAVGRAAADRRAEGPLLPTPRVSSDRTSRSAVMRPDSRSGPSLGQALEIARGLLPREFGVEDVLPPSWQGASLLPTPAVNDMGEGKTVEAWDDWTAKMKAKHNNGNGHGKSLAIELQRVESGWGPYTTAVEHWAMIVGRPAPAPSEPTLVREWMMGLPAGWVTDVPDLSVKEQKKALGNGVVWQQAAEALRVMESWSADVAA